MLGKCQEKYACEEVLFEGKASIFLECKKIAIYLGLIFFILSYSSTTIQFVAKMQESVVRVLNVPFTSYFALAIYFAIFILIVLIMLSLLSWKSKSYNITNIRVIAKRGYFISKTDYVLYSHIQDVSTYRGFFGKIFGGGTIKIFNGVDGGTVVLKNVSQIKNVEEIIFKQMPIDSQRYGGFNQGYFDNNNNVNNNLDFNNGVDNRFNNGFNDNSNANINNNYNHNNQNIPNQNNQHNNPNINIHDYYNTPYNRNNDYDLNNNNLNNSNINSNNSNKNYNNPNYNNNSNHNINNKAGNNRNNNSHYSDDNNYNDKNKYADSRVNAVNNSKSIIERHSEKFKKKR